MAIASPPGVGQVIDGVIEGQAQRLDPLAEQVQGWLRNAVARGGPTGLQLKNFLHGIWLGHPLHPALTDVPIGAWSAALLMDLFGPSKGADAAVAIGTLAAVPTALAGLADWIDTEGKPRRVGLVHATLNSLGLGLYVWSWLARRSGNRQLGVLLSTTGYSVGVVSAWLGGELVDRMGTGVSRNAWEPPVQDFQVAAREADLREGQLAAGEITVDGQKLPLVLLKQGGQIYALSGVCSHWGGPLAEGQLVGECVQCPWHGSQFSMRDGSVRQGPAQFAQPCFETRVRAGNVEVRTPRAAR